MESRKHGRATRQLDKGIESFLVNFHLEGHLVNTEDPDDYMQEITGELVHHVDPDDANQKEKSEVVGRVRAWLVQVGRAREEGQALSEVFDSINDNVAEYYGPLIDPKTDDFKTSIASKYEMLHCDVLIIDEITVVKAHRGKRLGIAAMLRTIETFGGGAGLVAIKPFPLQYSTAHKVPTDWDRKVNFTGFCTNENEAQTKLQRYWSTLGFDQIPGSEIFAMALALQHPSLKSLDLDKR